MNCRKRGMAKPKMPMRPKDKSMAAHTKASFDDKHAMERKPTDAGSTPKTGEIVSWS